MNDITTALKKLFPRRKVSQVKNHIDANGVDNLNIFGPFQHKSFKRSFIRNSKFEDSQIILSAWTGTRYEWTTFKHSIIRNSNMQSCVFTNCIFTMRGAQIKNTTFDDTLFINTEFVDVVFKSCNFTDVRFINCKFESCSFTSCNFDGANLVKCVLNNVIARNLNLDYALFNNCKIQGSEFSLFQLFYTIGLVQTIKNNQIDCNDNVLAFHGKNIKITDLLSEYQKYLITYYFEVGEFFPLANIYGFNHINEKFKETAILGIENAIVAKKFRLATHFSELINYYGLLKSIEKRAILDFMNDMLNEWQQEEDVTEYIKYIAIIENNLMYQYINRPVIYVNLRTENQLSDNDLAEFLLIVDNGFNNLQGKDGEHCISFSHNSPLFFSIMLAIGESIAGTAIYEGIKLLVKQICRWAKKRGNKIVKSSIKEINSDNETKYIELNNNSDDDQN